MRIISGKYKGQQLEGFTLNGTRPTMDRVKESIFGMIQTNIKNSVCLDLFAGSGALGLEALSNGAKSCYFVDHSGQAIQTIEQNIKKLKVNEIYVILKQEYDQALRQFLQKNISFDVIFLDPPYQEHFIQPCLNIIEEYHLLNKDGIIVCEFEQEKFTSGYTCVKEKKYGSKNVIIYQYK